MSSSHDVPRAKVVDMNTYQRRGVFNLYRHFEVPVYSTTVEMDIGKARARIRELNLLFSLSMTLLVTRAANAVPAFRHRMSNGGIVEHDVIAPLYSHLVPKGPLIFIGGTYSGDFGRDYANNVSIRNQSAAGQQKPVDLLHGGHVIVSVIPWYSFTSMTVPFGRQGASIPVVTIGKFHERNGAILMPLAVHTNHALIDGYHIGQFLDRLSACLADPERSIVPGA